MGNSPEICRKHYAALIPENMHDTVEFAPQAGGPAPPDDTRALLEEILARVSDDSKQDGDKPRLRVVRD